MDLIYLSGDFNDNQLDPWQKSLFSKEIDIRNGGGISFVSLKLLLVLSSYLRILIEFVCCIIVCFIMK